MLASVAAHVLFSLRENVVARGLVRQAVSRLIIQVRSAVHVRPPDQHGLQGQSQPVQPTRKSWRQTGIEREVHIRWKHRHQQRHQSPSCKARGLWKEQHDPEHDLEDAADVHAGQVQRCWDVSGHDVGKEFWLNKMPDSGGDEQQGENDFQVDSASASRIVTSNTQPGSSLPSVPPTQLARPIMDLSGVAASRPWRAASSMAVQALCRLEPF